MRALPRIAAAALAAAVLAAPGASGAGTGAPARAYVFTRASAYAVGPGELVTPAIVLPRATGLTLVNLRLAGHSITSDLWSVPDEVRLFSSDVIPFGETAEVRGVEALEPDTYGFFCSNHHTMRGQLIVV